MAIMKKTLGDKFTQIPNETLTDPRLSIKALGLLCRLLTLPDNWTIYINDLADRFSMSKHMVGKLLNELEEAGYFIRHQGRKKGGTFGSTINVVLNFPKDHPTHGIEVESFLEELGSQEVEGTLAGSQSIGSGEIGSDDSRPIKYKKERNIRKKKNKDRSFGKTAQHSGSSQGFGLIEPEPKRTKSVVSAQAKHIAKKVYALTNPRTPKKGDQAAKTIQAISDDLGIDFPTIRSVLLWAIKQPGNGSFKGWRHYIAQGGPTYLHRQRQRKDQTPFEAMLAQWENAQTKTKAKGIGQKGHGTYDRTDIVIGTTH